MKQKPRRQKRHTPSHEWAQIVQFRGEKHMSPDELAEEIKNALERTQRAAEQVEFWTQERFKSLGVLEHLQGKQQALQMAAAQDAPQPNADGEGAAA